MAIIGVRNPKNPQPSGLRFNSFAFLEQTIAPAIRITKPITAAPGDICFFGFKKNFESPPKKENPSSSFPQLKSS